MAMGRRSKIDFINLSVFISFFKDYLKYVRKHVRDKKKSLQNSNTSYLAQK